MQVEFDQEENFGNLADVEDLGLLNEELEDELEETEPEEEEEEEEEEDEDDFGYEMPIGPLPQMVNNDLKSLDEMVSFNFQVQSSKSQDPDACFLAIYAFVKYQFSSQLMLSNDQT